MYTSNALPDAWDFQEVGSNTGVTTFSKDFNTVLNEVYPLTRRRPGVGSSAEAAESDLDSVISDRKAEAMPESVKANWQRFSTSGMSGRLFEKVVRLATRPDGWRGPGSLSLTADAIAARIMKKMMMKYWTR